MINAHQAREYLEAVGAAIGSLLARRQDVGWEEFEYVEGTLIELVEQWNNEYRPQAEEVARRTDTE